MIPLTRLNGEHVAINPDRIERADITPDVVLTMTDGSKYVIAESIEELIDRIRLFRASIVALSQRLVFEDDENSEGEGRLRIVRGGMGGTVVDLDEPDPVTANPPNLRALDTGDPGPAPDPGTGLEGSAPVAGPDAAPASEG